MTMEFPTELQSLDDTLSTAMRDFAPPEGLADRAVAGLRHRNRLGNPFRIHLNPTVVKSAAAVAAVMLLGTFGYVADRELNSKPQHASAQSDASAMFDLKTELGDTNFYSFATTQPSSVRAWGDLSARSGARRRESSVAGDKELSKNLGDIDGPTGLNSDGAADWRKAEPAGKKRDSIDSSPQRQIAGEENDGRGKDSKQVQLGFTSDKPRDSHEAILRPQIQEGLTRGISDNRFAPANHGLELSGSNTYAGAVIINGGIVDVDRAFKETSIVSADSSFAAGMKSGVAQAVINDNLNRDGAAAGQAPTATPDVSRAPALNEPATTPVQIENSRRVIRSGDIEFEVDSFDSSLMTVTKLAIEDSGFIASTDSAKLPNGKTRGMVSVRVPPDRLDAFVLKLRGLGDLKTQKITSQDVSKSYSDTESALRAARAMEARLLDMIAKGQGAIKDLLAAEKELGTWREKIEQYEGQKRYYDNLISLSTLNITLQERDIKASAGAIETERISAGIETDDVEKARTEVIKAIDEAKGRVINSDLKKLDAGQFAATISAEIAPDKTGPIVDRLKQLGKVARLDVDRKQTTTDGQSAPLPGAHVEKRPSVVTISLYNLANVAPRLTTSVTLASNDVETSYRTLLAAVEQSGGRAVSSQLQRPRPDQVSATLQLEAPSAQAAALEAAVRAAGESLSLQLSENPDAANVTNAKQGFAVQIVSASSVPARETSNLQIAAGDVAAAHKALSEFATKNNVRVLQSNLTEGDRDNLTATLSLELPRAAVNEWDKSLAATGDVLKRSVVRSNDTQSTLDSKVRVDLTVYAAKHLPPRESTSATVNLGAADKAQASFAALAQELGGRVLDQNINRDPSGRNSSRVVIDVPRDKAARVIGEIRSAGEIWSMTTTSNPQAPDGQLSRARFDLTFAEGEALVGRDAGVWQSIREGLSTSLRGLAWSLQLIIIGLCLVAPWVLILWGGWKFLRRRGKRGVTTG